MAAQRFDVLDGMRGLAAILILQRHGPEFFGPEIGSTHLGLDMFWCLSGFVVANAYEQKLLNKEITFAWFVVQRLVRFWPLYIAAVLVMAAGALATGRDAAGVAINAILTVAFLPTPQAISGSQSLFPLLFVAWSLFWEVLLSIVYGLAVRWLTTRRLLVGLAIAGAALIATAVYFGTLNAGFYWSGFWAGGTRVVFAFMAGVLAFRFRPAGEWMAAEWPALAALGLVLVAPADQFRVTYDLAVAMIVLPLLVWFASAGRPAGRSAAIFAWLGAISYPLYLFHFAAFRFGNAVFRPEGATARPLGICLVVALLLVCWGLDRYFDRPVRQAIKRRLHQIPAFTMRKPIPTASLKLPAVMLRTEMRHDPADTVSTKTM